MAYVFTIVYRHTIKLELKNIIMMIRYVCTVKNILAIKINLLLKNHNHYVGFNNSTFMCGKKTFSKPVDLSLVGPFKSSDMTL